jgi:hypothetical protein
LSDFVDSLPSNHQSGSGSGFAGSPDGCRRAYLLQTNLPRHRLGRGPWYCTMKATRRKGIWKPTWNM